MTSIVLPRDAPITRAAGHPKGCNCRDGCAPVRRRYRKTRELALHNGAWEPLADAEPTIELIEEYLAAGWTKWQIGYVTGLSVRYIGRLLHRRREPSLGGVRPATVRAVRTLYRADRLDPAVPDQTLLNPVGSRRRLQALGVGCWAVGDLTERYGRSIIRFTEHDAIKAGVARTIAAIYAELWDVPGPSRIAARLARQRGWASAMAWEGLDIDDPRAAPHGHVLKQRTSAELAADSDELLRLGVSLEDIAARHGVTVNAIGHARKRASAQDRASVGDIA